MDAPTPPLNTSFSDHWVDLLRTAIRCGRAAQRALASQLDEQLNSSAANMLWACRDLAQDAPSQLELAAYVGLSPAQVSATVETLRCEGLLESQRSPTDRRRQVWRLTAAGASAVAELDERLAAWSEGLLDAFGAERTTNLSAGFAELAALVNAPSEPKTQPTLAAETVRRGAAA